MVTELQAEHLLTLAFNWGEVYAIGLTDDGIWTATPHGDPATILTAESPDELRLAIWDHYSVTPSIQRVPRQHDKAGKCWCGHFHLAEIEETERNDPE